MAETPETPNSVYDAVPLPLGKTMCIRVIKIRPSLMTDFSDAIACDFSILDVDRGSLLVDGLPQWPLQQEDVGADSANPTTALRATERIQYQALSYTWGEPGANRDIVLDCHLFSVRKNLWDFLDMARKSEVDGYLWIDALCINQATTKEKSHQVGMMGDVYSRASCVIVWLGSRTDAEEYEFQEALKILDEHSPMDSPPSTWFKFVFEFGGLSYWDRAWIVQEYFLATRKVIWYGRLRIDSIKIKHLIERWEARPEIRRVLMFSEHARMIAKELNYHSPVKFGTFTNLVNLFRYLHCSDSRDRVYALLPLLNPNEREDLGLFPDYSVSATSIFVQLVSRLWKELDQSENSDPHPIYRHLEIMLWPDLQTPAVQLAILNLISKGMHDFFGRDGENNFFNHHHCGGPNASTPIIGATGCSMCCRRPFLSLDYDTFHKQNGVFSESDWKVYIQALLASKKLGDRELGIEYCRVLAPKQRTTKVKLTNLIATSRIGFQKLLRYEHEKEDPLASTAKPC